MSSDQATLTAFASLLDTSADAHEPTVEISSLRRLAARGIPSHPPHLRPTTYSVLLGVLPKDKARWQQERANGRRKYADFATKFLGDVEQAPPPTHPLSSNDRLLDEISKDVSRTQVNLNFFSKLALAPAAADEAPSSSTSSSATIPSHLRSALGRRIDRLSSTGRGPRDMSPTRSKALAANPPVSPSPSMRSDVTARPSDDRDGEPSTSTGGSPRTESLALPHIPELDFGTSSFGLSDSPAKGGRSESSVAAPPPAEAPAPAQELHSDGLTRILYIFSLIHPQLSYTQGYAELLAPLYWVYAGQGVSPDDAGDEHEGGHWAEPDAFWAFLALMGEVGEVVKGPGRRPWGEVDLTVGGRPELDIQWALSRLSARLKWADETLWNDLRAKSLDPAQPFYAFRWVCTLLSQDIPLPSLLSIWDVILSEPPVSHDSLPKVDLLLDVCTAMLLLIRRPLLQAGRRRSDQSGLWGASEEDAGEFGPGFVEGMAILQRYPVQEVGVSRIIELALESRQRRILAELNGDGPEDYQAAAVALASTAAAATSTFSRLFKSHRSTPSVSTTDTPKHQPSSASAAKGRPSSTYGSSIAKYAEAFRESDTAAALSKRSSNLTAAAYARWEDYQHRLPAVAEDEHLPSLPAADGFSKNLSAPATIQSSGESSSRPSVFDPPGGGTPVRRSSLTPSDSLRSPQEVRPQGRSLQDRLAASLATPPALTPPSRSHTRSPSSGSKPLLLSSSARPPSSSPSAPSALNSTPTAARPAWATESPLAKRSPAVTERGTSPPPHFAPSASDSETSGRIPIGGSRRRSGQLQHQQSPTPLSPPGPIRTTFLKTTPKTQEAGIKLRAAQSTTTASPSPISRMSADLSSGGGGPRGLPRSPRSKGLGRPESFSSAGGDSDNDSSIRSGSRLARGMSGEGSQRGWTLTDDGPVSAPSAPTNTVLPPLERLDMAANDGPFVPPPQHTSQHARTQSSASSLGSPASPLGPRPPRKSSRAAVVAKQPARSSSSTRLHGRESSNPSDRDADDEDSTAEIPESYGGSDSR